MGTSLQTQQGISFVSLSYKQAGFRTQSLALFWKQYYMFSQSTTPPMTGKPSILVSICVCSYGTGSEQNLFIKDIFL